MSRTSKASKHQATPALELGTSLFEKGKAAFRADRLLLAYRYLCQSVEALESIDDKTEAVKLTLAQVYEMCSHCTGRADYIGRPAEPGKPWYYLSSQWTEKCINMHDELIRAGACTDQERVEQLFRKMNHGTQCLRVGLFAAAQSTGRSLADQYAAHARTQTAADAQYPFIEYEAQLLIAESFAAQGDRIKARAVLTAIIGGTNPLTLDPYSIDSYVKLCQAYRRLSRDLWTFQEAG